MSVKRNVEAVAATVVLGGAGALLGGPIGFAVGLAAGVVVDALLLHRKAVPMVIPAPGVVANAMIPGAGVLPPGANVSAATQTVTLLIAANTSSDPNAEAGPAKSWLSQFQTSVGLPATGSLDPQSRAMLVLAAPNAANLPAKTILG